MSQKLIEHALKDLITLLLGEEDNESTFQEYFEANPIVFNLLGFTEAHPHMNLRSDDGLHLIPDFLLKRENGLYEVCDIKLPSEKIIKKQKNRNEFYSKIGSEFAGQLRNYANYFSEKQNRDYVAQNYSLYVNSNPNKLIIIGRNENLDRFVLHDILNSRGHEFTIITYDDIVEYLTHSLRTSFVSEKQFFGTSFLIILKLIEVENNHNKYIVDFGDDEHENRFSIYLDQKNNLAFRIIDPSNNDLIIKAFKNRGQFEFNKYFYLHCSVGCSKDYSIMEMYVNGARLEKREFQYSLYKSRGVNFINRLFAANIYKKNGASLYFELIKCFNHNLNFFDRTIEDTEFFRRLVWTNKQEKLCTVYFDENARMDIPYKYGQKSPVDPGLEGHWDIHTLHIDGKFVLDHRRDANQIFNDA